jgi:hypothetical protein
VSQTELRKRYDAACDYPGVLDAVLVERHLGIYLRALNINRTIKRLPIDWDLETEPSLKKYGNYILDSHSGISGL